MPRLTAVLTLRRREVTSLRDALTYALLKHSRNCPICAECKDHFDANAELCSHSQEYVRLDRRLRALLETLS